MRKEKVKQILEKEKKRDGVELPTVAVMFCKKNTKIRDRRIKE